MAKFEMTAFDELVDDDVFGFNTKAFVEIEGADDFETATEGVITVVTAAGCR